jgi:hypothetical protein
MRARPVSATLGGWGILSALFFALSAPALFAADLKLEAQLVWGTNDPQSPDPKHKPVGPEVERKLKRLLKWQHYFVVNQKRFEVPDGDSRKVAMSKQCEIQVKNRGGDQAELLLFGKGELVEKRTQALPKGELLVIGGNAENLTAWLVVLKQIE